VSKKRIIKKFEQLSADMIALVKKTYPDGYEESLITFQTPKGELEIGLPLETEDTYYLIKMPKNSMPDEEDDFDNSEPVSEDFESFDSLQIADDATEEDE
jgi:hypothetical protein